MSTPNLKLDKFAGTDTLWNKSIQDLQRISDLQNSANIASCGNDWYSLELWRNLLDCLQSEILPLVMNDNDKEVREKIESLRVDRLPDMNTAKLLGPVPPYALRQKLRLWNNSLNAVIMKKGLGLQAKDKNESFILVKG